jgi:hypothetical protein
MRRGLVLLLAVIVAVGGAFLADKYIGKTSTPSGSTTSSTTSTSTSAPPIAPLTGLPDPTGLSVTRPALTVKVENDPNARPQWGINNADVLYEEIVNGGITRLAAVFNSHAPNRVGPVRSTRPTDVGIVTPYGGIFAFSGGAAYAVRAISKAPVTLVDESTAGSAMFRDSKRVPPYNLFLRAPQIFAFGGKPVPPPALFSYRAPGQAVEGAKIVSFTANFPSIYPVTWTWDAGTQSWDRTIFGHPDITATGVRLSPQNVIVQWITYLHGIGTENSKGKFTGTGKCEVFENGRVIHGTWSRSTPSSITVYRDRQGQVIGLVPGQTWVELLDTSESVAITR